MRAKARLVGAQLNEVQRHDQSKASKGPDASGDTCPT